MYERPEMAKWLALVGDLLWPVEAETRGKARAMAAHEYADGWFLSVQSVRRDRCKHGAEGVDLECWYRCDELCTRFGWVDECDSILGMPDEWGKRLICERCSCEEPSDDREDCYDCYGTGDATGEIGNPGEFRIAEAAPLELVGQA